MVVLSDQQIKLLRETLYLLLLPLEVLQEKSCFEQPKKEWEQLGKNARLQI